MQVNMKNSLARARAVIDDHAVTFFIKSFFCCDLVCREEQMADKFSVNISHALNVGNVFSGDHKDMHRSLGVDIFKRDHMQVFINDPGRDLFINNPAKNAAGSLISISLLVQRSF